MIKAGIIRPFFIWRKGMGVIDNHKQLSELREMFIQKCFEIVEKGVEGGDFRMKEVAGCLGISSQVASKLVNPTNPRILTAFELFRMSVLIRKPVTEIIPMDFYLTAEELNDAGLCSTLSAAEAETSVDRFLIESYHQLPENCRQSILVLLRTMREITKQT
jgi:hypothetical protein